CMRLVPGHIRSILNASYMWRGADASIRMQQLWRFVGQGCNGTYPVSLTSSPPSRANALTQLHGHSVTYRIATGPQQGRKVFTLQTLGPTPCASDTRQARKKA